jgi:hypothetical protein
LNEIVIVTMQKYPIIGIHRSHVKYFSDNRYEKLNDFEAFLKGGIVM